MRFVRSRRAVAAIIVLAILAAVVFAARGPVTAALIPRIIGSATGTDVTFGHMALHASHAEFTDVRVTSHARQQIAYIPRVDISYDLSGLLPGSQHRFGLQSLVVDRPQITIVHNPDGSYNLPPQAKKAATRHSASPLNFTAKVIDGSVTVTDYTRVHRGSKYLYIDNVNANAAVNTAGITRYTASLAYREGSTRYPIAGNGTVDFAHGSNLQHWTAARIPLTRIVNYAVNTTAMTMNSGEVRNLNAWYYGKLAASAQIADVKVAMAQLRTPIRNGNGALDVSSDAATTNGFTGTLNGIPVHVSGGVSDLMNARRLRFSITGNGDVSQITTALTQTERLPVRGPIAFAMLAEGTATAPLVLISVHSPLLDYNGTRLSAPAALVAYDGHEADILRAQVGYKSLVVGARGRVATASQPHAVEMIARVAGPSGDVPFASSVLPASTIAGSVLATADDLKKIDTQGVLTGSGPNANIAGLFAVSSTGVGTVGPLAIDTPHGSLFARVAIDHPHNVTQALVAARNFPVAYNNASASLSGNVYAAQQGKTTGMLGVANVQNARYGKIAISNANARFGGGVGNIAVSSLNAVGSFGSIHASGTISGTNRIALEGRYRGSLSALSSIAGNIPASGRIDAPIALVYDGGHAVAQIQNARFSGASVRGVPIRAMSATIGTRGKSAQIYAARAVVANGGQVAVTGSLNRSMALTVSNFNLADLRGAGLPLQAGRANLAATVRGPLNAANINGAVLLNDGLYKSFPIDAASALAYSGDTLNLRDGLVGVGPALVTIDGNVSGIRMGAPMVPAYDLNATTRAADAHALIAVAQPKFNKEDIQGSINAGVHVGGSGSAIAVNGSVDAPEGSVNGLAFRDMHATLDGSPQHFTIGNGGVKVGTTAVAFSASAGGGAMGASLSAPRANLADFNDYFNTGDTLAGTGRLAMTVQTAPSLFQTSGNVALRGVRFRRYDLGTADALWSTTNQTVAMNAHVGGNSGIARLNGTVTFPHSYVLADIAQEADTNLNATVSNLDVGTWMPMLGYNAPVTGKLNANATVRGRFPDETIAANAALNGATVGRVAVQRAQVALTTTRGHGTLQQAVVQVPYLTATGSGTFGLHANDPLNLALHASSPDVGSLMKTFSGKPQQVAGALDTTLRVHGTRSNPQLNDAVALSQVRYDNLTIPRVSATIAANRTQLAVRNGLVQLQRGTITASGAVPITMTPHVRLDPANKPVRFALAMNNVDLSNFESAMPHGTRLAGTIAGNMAVSGSLDSPQLDGTIAMHNGYYVGPIDQNPIQKMNGSLVFNGTSVALQALHAEVGGGTMDANATAHLPNVRDFKAASLSARIVAHGAQFNSPQYFRGKINADVTATRAAGAMPQIAGTVDVPSARIPLTAFWNPHAPKGPTRTLPPVGLNLAATVGNDVRVQSSNVDVGAQGKVRLMGTLASPALQGRFESTGGTVSFFRTFTVQSAVVHFDKANGIMPYVNAVATTNVSTPPTEVSINVTGLAPDAMHVAFSSIPDYQQSQIMGILAGVGEPSGPALAGAGDFSANAVVENFASSEINTMFTRQLLEPLSAQLGSALGLQDLQLTDDFASGFGVSAAKAFGKHITVVFDETMAQPQRESLSIEAHRGQSTAFDLLFYQSQSPTLMAFLQPNQLGFDNGAETTLNTPYLGTGGASLMYEHKF